MALRCAVFASGGGSNFQALLDRKRQNDLHVDFVLFVGNNSAAKAFERAQKNGTPSLHIAPAHFSSEDEYAAKLLSVLRKKNVDLIVLAGYMKKLPGAIIKAFHHRVVNIHPALLPAFGGKGMYGSHVHEAVIAYGAKITGVTVHFVDEEYDHGPIILQATIDVLDNDDPVSLAARVLKLEHASYWRAIEAIAQKKITLSGRHVLCRV
jgi:phosphoribosylglycinamide formyltransferase 1